MTVEEYEEVLMDKERIRNKKRIKK